MNAVIKTVFYIFMILMCLWSGTGMGVAFRNEDRENQSVFGRIFFGFSSSIIAASTALIYQKTNNITITILSLVIHLLLLIPLVAIFFITIKRRKKRQLNEALCDIFRNKLINWAVEKGSFSADEYEGFVDSLILSETPYNGYPHSKYKSREDNPNFNIYMDTAKSFTYSYPKTFVIDKERFCKVNIPE